MPDLNITLIQSELHWENVEANLAMFANKIAAFKEQTDLILLPEMFSTGFSMKPEKLAEEMNGSAIEWMKKQAKEKNAVICGSLIIKEQGKYYNRLIWMRPDGAFSVYDKRHLFRMGEENNHYSAGSSKITEEIKGWKILPLVCYDLRFPVWSRNSDNYDLLLYVANWPERRNHAWKSLLIARAIENQSYVLGLNRVGNDGNNIYYSGDSSVINFKGEIIFQEANNELVKSFTLKKEPLEEYRKEFPVLMDRDEFELK
jgi:predicted amidohydrolase